MARLAHLFLGLCLIVIAGSIGAVLHFQFDRPISEAVVAFLAIVVALFLLNMQISRSRERSETEKQVELLTDQILDLNDDMRSMEGRVTGFENNLPHRTRQEIEPVFAEVEILGSLVTQLAEIVANVETKVEELPSPDQFRQIGQEVQPTAVDEAVPQRQIAYTAETATPDNVAMQVDAPEVEVARAAPYVEPTQESLPVERIRDAVKANRVDLYLQPIMALPQRRVTYYETLTRLRDKDGSVLLPSDYLHIAEATGIMPDIDNLLLFRAVQILRRLKSRNREMALFCNISPTTLLNEKFFASFLEFIKANEGLRDLLIFEFTQENVRAMGPVELECLASLQENGFRFSVDQVSDLKMDFKTLADRGFQFAKISADRMLGRANANYGDIRIEDLAPLMARYGIELIVDHIEAEGQVIDLLDFDVSYGQGFLFSPPRPVRAEVLQGTADTQERPAQPASSGARSNLRSQLAQKGSAGGRRVSGL
ncbi:MAG: EAL domain-containing protein [Stappiaceae bacterium]